MPALLRWFGRHQPATPASAAAQPAFDAIITVGPYNLPEGVTPARAIHAIREAVGTIPGAGCISVEHHPAGSAERAVQVLPGRPGSLVARQLRQQVEAAVATALVALRPFAVATPFAAAPPGLAEANAAFYPGMPMAWQPARPIPERRALPEASDAELLAILLDRVLPEGGAAAARRAVDRFGSFAAVLALPAAELLKLPGFGPHSVAAIKLVHAAALRLTRAAIMHHPALTSFDALIRYLTAVLAREPLEHFRILFLDGEGRIRADEAQARGTVNHTPVYPREVVRRALELGAASVILVHNHPSGDPSPSGEDIEMTRMVRAACKVVGLDVQDHIIVGNGRWFSFSREGLLR